MEEQRVSLETSHLSTCAICGMKMQAYDGVKLGRACVHFDCAAKLPQLAEGFRADAAVGKSAFALMPAATEKIKPLVAELEKISHAKDILFSEIRRLANTIRPLAHKRFTTAFPGKNGAQLAISPKGIGYVPSYGTMARYPPNHYVYIAALTDQRLSNFMLDHCLKNVRDVLGRLIQAVSAEQALLEAAEYVWEDTLDGEPLQIGADYAENPLVYYRGSSIKLAKNEWPWCGLDPYIARVLFDYLVNVAPGKMRKAIRAQSIEEYNEAEQRIKNAVPELVMMQETGV